LLWAKLIQKYNLNKEVAQLMAAIIAQGPHYGDFRLFLIYFPWHNQLTICQFYFYLTAIDVICFLV